MTSNSLKMIHMKKLFFLLTVSFLLTSTGFAQRYAVIDTKYILEKIPEYKSSQEKLDQFSEMWQQEIDRKSAELERMYKNYDAEAVMLSDGLRQKREDEIYNKEI